jgi:hypothetical protein
MSKKIWDQSTLILCYQEFNLQLVLVLVSLMACQKLWCLELISLSLTYNSANIRDFLIRNNIFSLYNLNIG